MTPAARVQAAIEIVDKVIASALGDGPPADAIVSEHFRTRRYAGSKDRRAVRELVFQAIRRSGEVPASGRAALLGIAPELFDGSPHGPAPVAAGEAAAAASLVPAWIEDELSPLVGREEWPALLERAPVDLRGAIASTIWQRLDELPDGASRTQLSPWGIRLPPDSRVDQLDAYKSGEIEIQDEGSQLVALACGARDGMTILDLCAGAGGKALALAAVAPRARVIASDTNRARPAKLGPRAARAGATIEQRLLDGGREAGQLADLQGACDVVLIDAPCSGSGTWRRSPEGRWRLTPDRLDRLVALQRRLLDLAAPLVRPGGRLTYAVCSLLHREGVGQATEFLGRRSSWGVQDALDGMGRRDGPGRLLTPGHDRTDGFFIASFEAPC